MFGCCVLKIAADVNTLTHINPNMASLSGLLHPLPPSFALMSVPPLPSRLATFSWSSLLVLVGCLVPLPQPALAQSQTQAQSCPCSCAQPSLGLIGPDGLCQCSCASVPIPGISEETLAGPPKPPKAGGPEPTWNVEPGFDGGFDDGFGDGFGGPFWGGWW
jgi:hypothetical protein